MTTPSDRKRDRTSFQDLARLASATPAPPSTRPSFISDKEDSGVVDLKALAAADPHASERAMTAPLAASGLFDEPAPASMGPVSVPPAVHSSRVSAPPSSLSMQAATSVPSIPIPASTPVQASEPAPAAGPVPIARGEEKKKKRGAGLYFLGGGVAVLAAAAAIALVVRGNGGNDKPVATKEVPPVAATAAPKQDQAANEQQADKALDPNALPLAQGKAPAVPSAKGLLPLAPSAVKSAEPPATVASAEPEPPKPLEPAAPIASGDRNLESELEKMRQAAGTSAPAAAGTETPAPGMGSVPLKPSLGAVQGALGAVLPAARACLGADDAVSRATITFRSDGSVASVGVSGSAAGKPAEGCIRAALSRAKVPPFAQPTFNTPVTIRPN